MKKVLVLIRKCSHENKDKLKISRAFTISLGKKTLTKCKARQPYSEIPPAAANHFIQTNSTISV